MTKGAKVTASGTAMTLALHSPELGIRPMYDTEPLPVRLALFIRKDDQGRKVIRAQRITDEGPNPSTEDCLGKFLAHFGDKATLTTPDRKSSRFVQRHLRLNGQYKGVQPYKVR
jgi:hypothetical protein